MLGTGSNTLNTYRLSIRLHAGGFSFFIHNGLDASLVQQEDFFYEESTPAQVLLERALHRPRIMDYRFSSVELIVLAPTTCIPLEHFRKGDMMGLYKLNYPEAQITIGDIQYQILPSIEVVLLFQLNPLLLKVVQETYPDIQVSCMDGKILEETAEKDRKTTDKDIHLYAHVIGEKLHICSFRENRLHYTSTHHADNDADRIYFLFAIWKTLKLDEEKAACFLKGASKELETNIRKYLLKVNTCE